MPANIKLGDTDGKKQIRGPISGITEAQIGWPDRRFATKINGCRVKQLDTAKIRLRVKITDNLFGTPPPR